MCKILTCSVCGKKHHYSGSGQPAKTCSHICSRVREVHNEAVRLARVAQATGRDLTPDYLSLLEQSQPQDIHFHGS